MEAALIAIADGLKAARHDVIAGVYDLKKESITRRRIRDGITSLRNQLNRLQTVIKQAETDNVPLSRVITALSDRSLAQRSLLNTQTSLTKCINALLSSVTGSPTEIMVCRLQGISSELELDFHCERSDEGSVVLFISQYMFLLEVSIPYVSSAVAIGHRAREGAVAGVVIKVAHTLENGAAGELTVDSVLTACLAVGDFEALRGHLHSLAGLYALPVTPAMRSTTFRALKMLECDLHVIEEAEIAATLPEPISACAMNSVEDMIASSPELDRMHKKLLRMFSVVNDGHGVLLPRLGGHDAELAIFISPLACKSIELNYLLECNRKEKEKYGGDGDDHTRKRIKVADINGSSIDDSAPEGCGDASIVDFSFRRHLIKEATVVSRISLCEVGECCNALPTDSQLAGSVFPKLPADVNFVTTTEKVSAAIGIGFCLNLENPLPMSHILIAAAERAVGLHPTVEVAKVSRKRKKKCSFTRLFFDQANNIEKEVVNGQLSTYTHTVKLGEGKHSHHFIITDDPISVNGSIVKSLAFFRAADLFPLTRIIRQQAVYNCLLDSMRVEGCCSQGLGIFSFEVTPRAPTSLHILSSHPTNKLALVNIIVSVSLGGVVDISFSEPLPESAGMLAVLKRTLSLPLALAVVWPGNQDAQKVNPIADIVHSHSSKPPIKTTRKRKASIEIETDTIMDSDADVSDHQTSERRGRSKRDTALRTPRSSKRKR